ncbi:MAG: BON domain-containing protein [Sediminibacterium sp.]
MQIRKMAGMLAVTATMFLASCGPKDADINKNVADNIAAVPVSGVNASTTDGVVTLSGQVADEAARTSAETSAKNTKGVKSVVNNLTVAAPPQVIISPDEMLQKGVTDAIKDFPGATALVNDGEIMVSGELSAADWKRLKMSLDGLAPKKVSTTGLTIK